ADAHAYEYAHTHTDSYADIHTDQYANIHTDQCADGHTYPDAYSHADAHGHGYRARGANADGDAYAYAAEHSAAGFTHVHTEWADQHSLVDAHCDDHPNARFARACRDRRDTGGHRRPLAEEARQVTSATSLLKLSATV
ncbi:MAG TPA: hypothetical protein VKF32_16060, partial [Thermoanaerobaculia bacterium]|nr:hypothetical protein [Thermoanaerobaculia bacterium]